MMDWGNIFILLTWLLCAAALGSFANVLVYRLPLSILALSSEDEHANIVVPGSYCPQCRHNIIWWHNIPLLSFLFLRGRCAYCRNPIPSRYFWIELGTVLIALLCWYLYGWTGQMLMAFGLIYVLWVLVWIDALHQILPDVLTLGLLWSGLLLHACLSPIELANAIFGVALGYLILWLPHVLYLKWRGVAGLGLGDCKLLAAIGAWMGAQSVPYVLLLASVLGLSFGVAWTLYRKRTDPSMAQMSVVNVRIAFGPFIAAAAFCMLIVQPNII